jgi:hypothetical protein
MYPGGGPAQSGPGGPDMGRPPLVNPAAQQAIQQQVVANPVPSQVTAPAPGIAEAQQRISGALMQGQTRQAPNLVPQNQPLKTQQASKLAQSALRAAAQRRMKR